MGASGEVRWRSNISQLSDLVRYSCSHLVSNHYCFLIHFAFDKKEKEFFGSSNMLRISLHGPRISGFLCARLVIVISI